MKQVEIVQKPWGHEEWWAHTDKYIGKMLYIHRQQRLNSQYHKTKQLTIRVMSGVLFVALGDEMLEMISGDVVQIDPCIIYYMETRNDDAVVMEVSSPEVHDNVMVRYP